MRRALGPLLAAIALAGCGGSGSSHTATASHPPGTTAAAAAPGHCTAVPRPPSKGLAQLKPPSYKLNPRRTYTVTVLTNCGAFAFTLDVKHSPKTSASFYSLVKRGFFDRTIFHRVVPGFVIQGGDPTGTGTGGPGYTVVEPPPHTTQYVFGDVAMARAQNQPSGASGSQFFIVIAANATQSAGLPPTYALVGKLVSGQKVVTTIGTLPTSADQMPTPAVVMSKVTVAVSG
jgi:cyclophilin family peptidyl-prolyl cis-trans isomerase